MLNTLICDEAMIDGTILEVSPSIEIMSKGQYHRHVLIGKSIYDFYPNVEERQTFLAAMQERGIVTGVEVTLMNRDGSHIPCSMSSKVRCDAQGHPEIFIGSMRDITGRRRVEELLGEATKEREKLMEDLQHALNRNLTVGEESLPGAPH